MSRQVLLAIVSVAILSSCSRQTSHESVQKVTQHNVPSSPEIRTSARQPDFVGPFRVGGDVKAPIAILRREPDFSACTGRYSGIPIAEATITSEGEVRDVRLLSSVSPCVDTAVLTVLKQWKFKPGTLNGKPVDVVFNLTVQIHYR